jgi:hypothetical protein
VIHFIIIEEYSPAALQKAVNDACDKGYRPQGGMAVAPESGLTIPQSYLMAMVREEK